MGSSWTVCEACKSGYYASKHNTCPVCWERLMFERKKLEFEQEKFRSQNFSKRS